MGPSHTIHDLPHAVPWTSRKAYGEIHDSLPRRRREVLYALLDYIHDSSVAPTAQELREYMASFSNFPIGEDDHAAIGEYSQAAIESCWKRLTELADLHSAIHRSGPRTCGVTGHTAITWAPGPPPSRKLGQPRVNVRLVSRLRTLLKHVPYLNKRNAMYILGVSEKTLESAWKHMEEDNDGTRTQR